MTPLSAWNHYPKTVAYLKREEQLSPSLISPQPETTKLIARGYGKSYGDAPLNHQQTVVLMERLNRFLSFDPSSGRLSAEAGVSLADIVELFVPQGWFLPVTPGTKYVTLGGCFAADIHGKNHHREGSFSQFVQEITLLLPDGTYQRCSKESQSDLFWATAGGMGLTGIITEIKLQLKRISTSWMTVSHHHAKNIHKLIDLLENETIDEPYSVAWIDALSRGDALGRGVLMTAHHTKECAQQQKTRQVHSLPRFFPSGLLNSYTVKAFNFCYYHAKKAQGVQLTTIEDFFYPLDVVTNWNNIYGKKGFLQYQCVIPSSHVRSLLPDILDRLAKSGAPLSCRIKTVRKESLSPLAFPLEGMTLALDLSLMQETLFSLLDTIDQSVAECGGRVYLAKDARLSPEMFRNMYPRYPEWLAIKQQIDPNHLLSSNLSRRLQFL